MVGENMANLGDDTQNCPFVQTNVRIGAGLIPGTYVQQGCPSLQQGRSRQAVPLKVETING